MFIGIRCWFHSLDDQCLQDLQSSVERCMCCCSWQRYQRMWSRMIQFWFASFIPCVAWVTCNKMGQDRGLCVLNYYQREDWTWLFQYKLVCSKEGMGGLSSFLKSTNNHLESSNGKLKGVIGRHSSLEEFVEHFFIILTALRTEQDHSAALTFQKVKIYPFAVKMLPLTHTHQLKTLVEKLIYHTH